MNKAYEDQIDAWHTLRVSTLKNDRGWLTVVAGQWLKEGSTVMPNIGTIALHRGKVSVQLGPGRVGTIGDEEFTAGYIKTEGGKGGPDKVKVGSRTFVVMNRGERFLFRMWDTDANVRKNFAGISRFPVSRDWRIEAQWEPYKKARNISLRTSQRGYNEEYKVPGSALLNLGGKVVHLEPVEQEGSEQMVFMFADATNGRETYVDGRYLYAVPLNNATVVLDFNKAINPPCVFTRHAICPLPFEASRLGVRIEAGEKTYTAKES